MNAEQVADYTVQLRDKATLDPDELATLVAILAEGEAVDIDAARQEIPRATRLIVATKAGRPVALGAIKRDRSSYAKYVQSQSRTRFGSGLLELGYVAVAKSDRGKGLSNAIVRELLAGGHGDLFATTDSDFMKRTLKNNGFAQCGQEWEGNRGTLSLWVLADRSRPKG